MTGRTIFIRHVITDTQITLLPVEDGYNVWTILGYQGFVGRELVLDFVKRGFWKEVREDYE